ncbi:MAG: hypothetical protein WCF04_03075 [Candidatus Nanopelagicales bacterium]
MTMVWVAAAVLISAAGVLVVSCGVTAKRWWCPEVGRSVVLPAVVQGTGLGLYREAMPGPLHLRQGEVWWVAERTHESVRLQGRVDSDPASDAEVPRELTVGVMRSPTTLRVQLDAGGWADLTVHSQHVQQVLAGLTRVPAAVPSGSAPRRRAHPPIGRLGAPCVGLLLMFAGYCARYEVPLVMIAGLLALLLGSKLVEHGVAREWRRRKLVRVNSASRNIAVPAGRL